MKTFPCLYDFIDAKPGDEIELTVNLGPETNTSCSSCGSPTKLPEKIIGIFRGHEVLGGDTYDVVDLLEPEICDYCEGIVQTRKFRCNCGIGLANELFKGVPNVKH